MPAQEPRYAQKKIHSPVPPIAMQFPATRALKIAHLHTFPRCRRYAIQFPHSNAVHYSSTENSMPAQVPDIQRKRRYAMQFPDSSWKATQCSSLIYTHCKHRIQCLEWEQPDDTDTNIEYLLQQMHRNQCAHRSTPPCDPCAYYPDAIALCDPCSYRRHLT